MPLLIVEHHGTRRMAPLARRILIGRRMGNHIVIDDRSVSMIHAWIDKRGEQCVLTDTGSRTGTSVNGKRITRPLPLCDGDVITVGPATLTFLSNGEESEQQPAESKVAEAPQAVVTPPSPPAVATASAVAVAVAISEPPAAPPVAPKPIEASGDGWLFDCACGAPLWAGASFAGRTAYCRYCGREVRVPDAAGAESRELAATLGMAPEALRTPVDETPAIPAPPPPVQRIEPTPEPVTEPTLDLVPEPVAEQIPEPEPAEHTTWTSTVTPIEAASKPVAEAEPEAQPAESASVETSPLESPAAIDEELAPTIDEAISQVLDAPSAAEAEPEPAAEVEPPAAPQAPAEEPAQEAAEPTVVAAEPVGESIPQALVAASEPVAEVPASTPEAIKEPEAAGAPEPEPAPPSEASIDVPAPDIIAEPSPVVAVEETVAPEPVVVTETPEVIAVPEPIASVEVVPAAEPTPVIAPPEPVVEAEPVAPEAPIVAAEPIAETESAPFVAPPDPVVEPDTARAPKPVIVETPPAVVEPAPIAAPLEPATAAASVAVATSVETPAPPASAPTPVTAVRAATTVATKSIFAGRPREVTPSRPANLPAPKGTRTCGICQSGIVFNERTTTCPACGLTFHADCWIENRGCSAYGCSQVGILDTKKGSATADADEDSESHDETIAREAADAEHEAKSYEVKAPFPWEFATLACSAVCVLISLLTFGVPSLLVAVGTMLYLSKHPGVRRKTGVLLLSTLIAFAGVFAGILISWFWYFGGSGR